MRALNLVLFFICGCLLTLGGYYLYFEFTKPSARPTELAVQIMNVEEVPKNESVGGTDETNSAIQSQALPQEKYARNLDANYTDAPILGDEDELKEQIRVLRAQNKLLYDDNVDLVGKNLEISNLLNDQQAELETRRKQAASANDKQRLSAIDELNEKLAKAQEENEKNKNLEQNLTSLRSEIKTLKAELEKKQSEFDKSSAKTQNESQNALKRLEAQNDELKNEATAAKAKFESELRTATEEAAKLKSENARLTNELGLKDTEIKRIASEYNAQALNAQNLTKSRIEALEKEQNADRKKISELEASLENANKKAESKAKLKSINSELNATNKELVAKLEREKKGFEKEVEKILAMHKTEFEKLKNQLEKERQDTERNVTELKGKIYELEDQISKKDSSLKSAEAKVVDLNESLNIQKELLADEIAASKKNIQNYKILNNKITTLVENNIKADKENKEQIDALNKLLTQKDAELATLKKQMQDGAKDLSDTKENLAKTSTQKNVAKGEVAQILTKNEELMSENENLKKIIQLNFKAEVPKKVVFIASVECSDMSAGSDRPTQVCKNKVSDFLQSYNSNYYFEITPIVSRGNFIATSKAAKVIPQDELEKINSYANFGIGKERAKVAGEMIKDEFGDFSRISYSNDIITSQDKQGFIIKVYR
ncbi:vesicular transport factor Uso1p [Campylobacter sp. Marseille-Q3452]|uniref:Vesicular transport factor Uso1p n=1 Tax=Campylobacter massiliensis TaxID=2762557 RepID=A0A842JEF9_9BACT|nr:vesicular transport factor Uso1p [Campylobacter massiliensis]MBC2883424.1 vesicular transport factor Uso1p [Campylobacter massiliensis]